MKLNPVWLNTFKTLIENRHFTRTAEVLHMTQPGVSQHIQKLEAACGYDLIKRQKKSFDITHSGELLYNYILTSQQHESDFFETLGANDKTAGTCALSCSGSLATLLYSSFIELQKKYENLVIHLEAAPNNRILQQISNGQTDLGIVTQKPDPLLFSSEIIGKEELVLVFPSTKSLGWDTLADEITKLGLIRHPDIDHYLRLYLAHCDETILTNLDVRNIKTKGYVNQIHQILLPVSQGLGFTVLPRSTVNNFALARGLKILDINSVVAETLYLVKKRNRHMPARFEMIKSQIKRSLN
ncbi:LysR family transcriptional regulator [Aliiglaciecola sp. 3_MG-2023]|uniref:LysR family transcriptional regulator n=1 Tax=Aliiglaciecola sp. 3_MG-2023 TaxID=3062644 RepID=UPI0026E1D2C4|nr:LysR family transcriptional regulator [Aliiglaciecola sp. 3_MG-2023]MDO6693782.1 LysR family transcriptional regulator [Aliiglaciecola sp. 3_MG-2023]